MTKKRSGFHLKFAAIEDEPLWLLVSLQHGQLMAQCDDLGEHYGLAARAHEKGIQQH